MGIFQTIVLRIILLPICGLVCSQAALVVAHEYGWYPERQLAQLMMASPSILHIEWVRWILIALSTVGISATADYFLYRRNKQHPSPKATTKHDKNIATFNESASKLSQAMEGAFGRLIHGSEKQVPRKRLSKIAFEERGKLYTDFFKVVNGPVRDVHDAVWGLYNDQPRLINTNQKAVFDELVRVRTLLIAAIPQLGKVIRESELYPDIRNMNWNFQEPLLGTLNEIIIFLDVPVNNGGFVHVDSKVTDGLKQGISALGEWVENTKSAIQEKRAEDDAAEIVGGPNAPDKKIEDEKILTPEPVMASAVVAKTHPHDIPKKLTIIDDEIFPIIRDGGEIEMHVWHGRQLLNGWKQSIVTDRPAYMRHLQEYDQNQTSILDGFAKLQKKHSHFEDIASLLDIPNSGYNYMETITKGFVAFKGAIGSIGDPPYTMDLDYFFNPTQQNFSSGLENLAAWRKHVESEFIQLRKQIASGQS